MLVVEEPLEDAVVRRAVVLNPDGIRVITSDAGLAKLRKKDFRMKVLMEEPGGKRRPAWYLLELR